MRMRRVLVALALACAPLVVGAGDGAAEFERIARGLSHAPALRAQFVQTKTIAAMTRPIVLSGDFLYARTKGVLWNIERPYRARYVLSERGIREVSADGVARADGTRDMQHVGRILRALLEPDVAVFQFLGAELRDMRLQFRLVRAERFLLRADADRMIESAGAAAVLPSSSASTPDQRRVADLVCRAAS